MATQQRIIVALLVFLCGAMLAGQASGTTEAPTEAPEVETTEAPEVEPTEAPEVETTEPPEVEPTEAPEVETSEPPEVEPTEAPEVETTEAPEVGTTEVPEVGTTEVPEVGTTEAPEVGTTEAPEVGTTEVPEVGTTEAPEVETTEAPEVETTEAPEVGTTEEAAASLECKECGNGMTAEQCSNSSITSSCKADEVCFTIGIPGPPDYHEMGCVEKESCYAEESANYDCHLYPCTYCCNDTLCNADVLPDLTTQGPAITVSDAETTTAKIQTTPMPTTPIPTAMPTSAADGTAENSTSAAPLLECKVCDINSTAEQCGNNTNTTFCLSTHICVTKMTAGSPETFEMGCMDEPVCYSEESSNTDCGVGTCTYCCNTSLCNAGEEAEEPTQTTPAANATTAAPLLECKVCDINSTAEQCGNNTNTTFCLSTHICVTKVTVGPPETFEMGCMDEPVCYSEESMNTDCEVGICTYCCNTSLCNAGEEPEEPTQTTPSANTTTAAPSLECKVCDIGSTAEQCGNNTNTTFCSSTHICVTKVTAGPPDTFEMGCMDEPVCYSEEASNSDCEVGICTYCCNTSRCNAGEEPEEPTTSSPTTIITTLHPPTGTPMPGTPTTTVKPATTTTARPFRNETLHCLECIEDVDTIATCYAFDTNTECSSLDEVCFSTISEGEVSYMAHKGCMVYEECVEKQQLNPWYCDYGVINDNCTWCCEDEDECNYDKFNYTDTIPATTPPPATTCSFVNVHHCMDYFRLNVANALTDPEVLFSEFCRSVSGMYACIAQSTEGCCEEDKTLLNATFQALLGEMDDTCPEACSVEAGVNCTTDLYERLVENFINFTGNCESVEEILDEQRRCIQIKTGSCESHVRQQFNFTYMAIEDSVKTVCKAPPAPVMPPEENPSCPEGMESVFECINELKWNILLVATHGGDMKALCKLVEETEVCVREGVYWCSDYVQYHAWLMFNFTAGIVQPTCEQLEIPICDTAIARGCILELWSLIEEAKDFQKACNLVVDTTECVSYNMAGCTHEEQTAMNKSLQNVLDMIDGRCEEVIVVHGNRTIVVKEGGSPGYIDYEVKQRPSDICQEANCKVYIEFDIETGTYPITREGNAINQVVIGGDDEEFGSNYCARELTESNWDQIFSLPIYAKMDFKYDGTQTRKMTMWMTKRVGDKVIEKRSIEEFTVIALDYDGTTSCKSINDPHITTFDDFSYNHFHEGHYTLYKHAELPFEVETIFQRCNEKATCNCGIAVKSGDTVFFVERCRKKHWDRHCKSKGKGKKHDKHKCVNMMKVDFFYHDKVTPGTHVFSKNDGSRFEVILPHGTVVEIAVNREYLNFWITPSPADWRMTQGLCGTFNSIQSDDLTMPDGEIYHGEGNTERGQPVGFSKSWKKDKHDRIYKGVDKDPYEPPKFCECVSSTVENNYINSTCGTQALFEFRDYDWKGEITGVASTMELYGMSKKKGHGRGGRNRRQVEDEYEDFDMDDSFEPEAIPDDPEAREAAEIQCRDHFNSIESAATCQTAVGVDIGTEIDGCIEDLVVTGETSWMDSAVEAIKESCSDKLSRDPYFATEAGQAIAENVTNLLCPNECSGNGTCVEGVCQCNGGFLSEDCSVDINAPLDAVQLVDDGLCETRSGSCDRVRVQAAGFVEGMMKCFVKAVTINAEGAVDVDTEYEEVEVTFESKYTMRCHLVKLGSYRVKIQKNDDPMVETDIHVAHDAVCHDCYTQYDDEARTEPWCERRYDSCLMDAGCFAPTETHPDDRCQICTPEKAQDKWHHNEIPECDAMSTGVIVAIAVACAALVIILVVAGVYLMRSRNKKDYLTSSGSFTRRHEMENAMYDYNLTQSSNSSSEQKHPLDRSEYRFVKPDPKSMGIDNPEYVQL